MDPDAALARNGRIVSRSLQTSPDPAEAGPAVASGLLVDVVVLSNDMALFESAREAMGERNPVWRARSADEAADLLITGRCGVLLIDTRAVSMRADSLIVQISEQFPDVVTCVAGMRDDEPLLAPMISDGLVYRFMHKPVTARRAGMFLQAAARHHLERRHGLTAQDPLPPLMRRLARPAASLKWVYLVTLLAAIGVVTSFLVPGVAGRKQADPMLAGSAPRNIAIHSNPVLSRARAALAAGRHESPAGRNALDLFKAVLLEQPDHVEARAGLEASINKILERARAQHSRDNRSEANRLVQRVLSADPHQEDALLLALQLNPPETPSRHLEREQIEAARLAAQAHATLDAGVATRREVETSLPVATPDSKSAPAPQVVAQPVQTLPFIETPAIAGKKAASATVRQPVQVRPDPLAPRYSNPPKSRAESAGTRVARSYAAPAAVQHEIAGVARDPVTVVAPGLPIPVTIEPPELQFVSVDELDRIETREPVYPAQALRDRTHGSIELEFTITETGTVRDIAVLDAQPSGVFERAARDAVAGWRFRPRYVNGQPVQHRSSITMRFAVDD